MRGVNSDPKQVAITTTTAATTIVRLKMHSRQRNGSVTSFATTIRRYFKQPLTIMATASHCSRSLDSKGGSKSVIATTIITIVVVVAAITTCGVEGRAAGIAATTTATLALMP
jgi:hypothetical protein